MFPPNRGPRGSRHRRSRTASNRLHSDASLVNPATQPSPIVTGGCAQSDDHGSWHNTLRRVGSRDEYGDTWPARFHAMPMEVTVSDDGYESSVVEPNTDPGYNPHGYTNISPALVNSRHLGVEGLAPGSPSSLPHMTDDTGSDSWMGDSSQTNQSFGPETTSMDTSNGFHPGSCDGRDAVSPMQDVSMWDQSQQFQPFTEYGASPLRVPVGLIAEFQGIPAIDRESSWQPWSPLQPPQCSVPVIVVSEHTHYPIPPGVYPSHTWDSATNTSNPSIGHSERLSTLMSSTPNAVYPEVYSPMSLSTDFSGGGSLDAMLQEVGALSYPPSNESVPRSV
jgi:hypothetical protein